MEENKEEEDTKEHGEGEIEVKAMARMGNGEVIVDLEIDFKPIEHPPEPPQDDQPIKCPIPDPLSLIVEEVFQEPCTEPLQTITQLLEQKERCTKKPSDTDKTEKHQITLPEHTAANTTTDKSPHHKRNFQLFQQCKELDV